MHWFETYENLIEFTENIYKISNKNGKLRFRFSLDKHGEKAKQFLQRKINEFYNREDIEIQKSNYDYNSTIKLFKDKGFEEIYTEEIKFQLFDNISDNLLWLLYSQPIRNYVKENDYNKFIEFIKAEWSKNKVDVDGHHGIFIMEKINAKVN